jgi:hypothetical protein
MKLQSNHLRFGNSAFCLTSLASAGLPTALLVPAGQGVIMLKLEGFMKKNAPLQRSYAIWRKHQARKMKPW